ncbi:hypothetical protein [Streptomyces cavernicola]|uniref:Uncharacterized protein n=1 Tax=Streptomyces cavernicola TaxID=3043613 RepID=A0ABT6SB36_9ACTN|nr:hypothetical protein [Streptomyces sp. B-S-A6]MDI3405403.1 hypothetical protein [Streptomyces sp. B-S-A6]
MSGYKFDHEAAKQVEKGLTDAIGELEEVGYFSITAQQGHGFVFLMMSGLDMGDRELADVFGAFCGRWGLNVKMKIQDANELAAGLNLNAGLYHEQEQYVVGSLKEIAVTAGSPDPAQGLATGQDAADKSWSQIAQDAAKTKPVDFSLPDFDEMGDQWSQVGEDFESAPYIGGEWQWDGPPEET